MTETRGDTEDGTQDGTELERLRRLLGPSERAYEELRRDVEEARRVAKEALAETGRLRGQLTETNVQLARARQDQDVLLRRAEKGPLGRVVDRVSERWRRSVVPRLRRLRRG
jgi:hypothetical protein